jgi:HTH-type transcriptional repressor of NAD biosynthesis genes
VTPRTVTIVGASGTGKSWLLKNLSDSLTARGHDVIECAPAFRAEWPELADTGLTAPAWVILEQWPHLNQANNSGLGSMDQPRPSTDKPPPEPLTLMMGMDLPGLGLHQQHEDRLVRQALGVSNTPFRVIYGQGMDRLSNALRAVGLPGETTAWAQTRESDQFHINRGRDTWQCNDCSDPGCEHRLFTGLLAGRSI